MASSVLGIHHVTAIAGDPQQNIDFYTQVLGLRLVKVTVDVRDPEVYQFVYGTGIGQPGTLLTFRCWPGAIPGHAGTGQVHSTSLGAPPGSLEYWRDRLIGNGIAIEESRLLDSFESLSFRDPDGVTLELVADEAVLTWPTPVLGPIPTEYAIRGLHGITIWSDSREGWEGLIAGALGLPVVEESTRILRYSVPGGGPGAHVTVSIMPDVGRGLTTVGFVNHAAFRVEGCELDDWRTRLTEFTDVVGPVEDLVYFRVVQFEGPQGTRLELASDGPGLTADEPPEELGARLALPPWLEERRSDLERQLPPLRLPGTAR